MARWSDGVGAGIDRLHEERPGGRYGGPEDLRHFDDVPDIIHRRVQAIHLGVRDLLVIFYKRTHFIAGSASRSTNSLSTGSST